MAREKAQWLEDFDALRAEIAAKPISALDRGSLEEFRVRILGRKGWLTELLKELKDFSIEERRELGPKAQDLKSRIDSEVSQRQKQLEAQADQAQTTASGLDLTLPAFRPPRGRLHPLTATIDEIAGIFLQMGFSWAEGPLVETDYHNFTALNIPEYHPARDLQDTFYVEGLPLLLRTQTSPVQIRTMESQRPPLRIICPGRVFRHEAVDATHSAVFHQVEGLCVDKGISFADLKGTISLFLQKLFGAKTRTLFRPTYFPFTEPSADVYVSCVFCEGKGCPVCKRTGWIELLGCGLVHPKVLRNVSCDPESWSGFAFGIGVERVAMLRLGVSDIRSFYENDVRFLRQFDENLV